MNYELPKELTELMVKEIMKDYKQERYEVLADYWEWYNQNDYCEPAFDKILNSDSPNL